MLVFQFTCVSYLLLLFLLLFQEADAIIDELKDQVDAALGAEEMVEKLTDTNLELEEKLTTMAETVADLEVLRDLSEEQEELRMEVEHDLREELDMSLNSVRLVCVCVCACTCVLVNYILYVCVCVLCKSTNNMDCPLELGCKASYVQK